MDRLAGQPALSNAQSRSYSPLPRRSTLTPQSGSPRPGFNPRSSALSLVSNDSTTSLLGNSKKPNGTGLKQSSTTSDHPDPLELLDKLLEFENEAKGTNAYNRGHYGADFVDLGTDVDFNGLSLVELARSEMIESDNFYVYRSQSIEECMYLAICFKFITYVFVIQMKKARPDLKACTVQLKLATMFLTLSK